MTAQMTARRCQIEALKLALSDDRLQRFAVDEWGIAMEFVIPRRMGRIDAVLLVRDAIVGLEFKTDNVDSAGPE